MTVPSEPPRPAISVCVAVYRHHDAPTVADLARSIPAALDGLEGELIVTLNGIDAEQLDLAADVVTVPLETNHGVAIGWNRAASVARGEVVCFVNDDLVLGPRALRLLVEALRAHPDAAVVGPRGALWNIDAARHTTYVTTAHRPPGDVVECDMVSGFCFAVRRDVFEQIGGIDEAYTPCGFEEIDLCTAVRADAGRRVLAVAGVEFRHEFAISAADPRTVVRYLGKAETLSSIERRNRAHFLGKWRGRGITSVPVAEADIAPGPARWKVVANRWRRRVRSLR
ncbi:MAG: glycosyltransferase [Solirubrobacteraceae bacterium]|nr:glycosyltransferase [Solirubrobacteraceae bacterium]